MASETRPDASGGLRLLADWFDAKYPDDKHGGTDAVQRDLRRWAAERDAITKRMEQTQLHAAELTESRDALKAEVERLRGIVDAKLCITCGKPLGGGVGLYSDVCADCVKYNIRKPTPLEVERLRGLLVESLTQCAWGEGDVARRIHDALDDHVAAEGG